MKSPRVISLLPGCTEIVCALGLREHLVGRSHECDYPAEIRSLPACTAAKIAVKGSSAEIDRQVKTLLKDALSSYRIDAAKLKKLRPDVILTQAQCKVCAVSLEEVEQAVAEWTGARPRVISFSPQRLAEVWDEIRDISVALGAEEAGRQLLRSLKNRCVDVIEKVCVATRRPTVACIEWFDPLMAAGNWVPELVDLAGGKNLFGRPGKHSPWLEWKAIMKQDPEVLVLMPCGFSIARAQSEMQVMTQRPGWSELKAVKAGKVYLADGSQYFNRPGPRIVESLEILAELLHPASFPAKHHETGWVRWTQD